jgi:hypothetical protein
MLLICRSTSSLSLHGDADRGHYGPHTRGDDPAC